MAVKQVAREGSKDAKANSKVEGGVGPLGNLVPCPPPPSYQRSAWQVNLRSLCLNWVANFDGYQSHIDSYQYIFNFE
jgi:hypothetical protein